MKIRTRVAILAVLPVAFALIVGLMLWLTAFRLSEASTRAGIANDIIDANHELNILAMEYLLYGEARPVAQWWMRHRSLGVLLERAPVSPSEREQWQELRKDYDEIARLFEQLTKQPASPRVSDWRQRVASQLLIRSDDMRSLAGELVQIYEQRLFWSERQADALVIALFVILASLSAAMSAVFMRGLNKSLSRLTEGVSHIAAGDLLHKINLPAIDELGELAVAFDDMTRRLQQSYTSLTAAEQRYRNLFENMADGYALHEIIVDKNGVPVDYRFLEVNPAFERMLGIRREDIVGKTAREVMPQTELHWVDNYGRVALTGEPARFEQYSAQFERHFEVSATSPQRGFFAVFFADVTERRKAAEALRESEEQLSNLFNSSPAGMFVVDRDFRFLRINEPLANVNGPTVAEHLGKTVPEVLPKLWPALEPLYRRVMGGETIVSIEVSGETRRDPGTVFYWNASYFPIRSRGGQIVGLGGVVIDITRRKQAETERDRASAYNRSLIEASLDPLVTIGPDGKITDVNAATEAVTGFPRTQLIGTDFSNYFIKPERARAGYEQAFREGFVRDYALEIRHVNGNTTPVLYNATVYRDPEGNVIGVFAAARDVSARKRAEEEARRLMRWNKLILDSAGEGVYGLDLEGRCTFINPAAAFMLGYTEEELIGRNAHATFHHSRPDGSPYPEEECPIQRVHVEALPSRGSAEVYWRKDGTAFPVEYVSVPALEEGKVVGTVTSFLDITERKRTEQELDRHRRHLEELVRARTEALQRQASQLEAANTKLRELDRLKSMFIASMSHELRTPLNTIIGFTGIILQGMVGEINAEQRKQLTMVKESAVHLLSLVNDVIDISKIEAGNVVPSVAPFDLVELVKEVAESVAVAVRTKGLTLSLSAPEQLGMESDRRRVRQILINLIGNAIKFTDQGTISVTARKVGDNVEIAVRDTGIGIAAGDIGRLFTAFSQIITEGRPREGSGLGLYLSDRIAMLLGGNITARSELGVGSTFTVSLPLAFREPK